MVNWVRAGTKAVHDKLATVQWAIEHSRDSTHIVDSAWFISGKPNSSFQLRRATHFFAVPLLPAPAQAGGINDAGAGAAAAFVVLHVRFSWMGQ